MKKLRIKLIIAICFGIPFILLFFFLQNKSDIICLSENYIDFLDVNEVVDKRYEKTLDEYRSINSVGFLNNDGTKSIYLFSRPIYYINNKNNYVMIDTRIKSEKDDININKGYKYSIADSDINVLFPERFNDNIGVHIEKETSFDIIFPEIKLKSAVYDKSVNFIGKDKNTLSYMEDNGDKEFKWYPTTTGANCEILYNKKVQSNEIKFSIKLSDENAYLQKESGGYLSIYSIVDNEKDIVGLIQKPLIKNNKGEISYFNDMKIDYVNGAFQVTCSIDSNFVEEDSTALISYEITRDNERDNSLYSNKPDLTHNFLCNYNIVGNSNEYGVGKAMISFSKIFSLGLKPEQIISAKYSIYDLSNNMNDTFVFNENLEDWCSVQGNWNSNFKVGDIVDKMQKKSSVLTFDLSDEVKKWCVDEVSSRKGIQLSCESNGNEHVFLSNDNTLINNYTEIKVK